MSESKRAEEYGAIFLCSQLGLAQPSQEILHLLERVPSPIPLEDYMQAFMEAKSKLED